MSYQSHVFNFIARKDEVRAKFRTDTGVGPGKPGYRTSSGIAILSHAQPADPRGDEGELRA